MKRMNFDSEGRLIGVDGTFVDYKKENSDEWDWNESNFNNKSSLKKEDSLYFLKEDTEKKSPEDEYWNLYKEDEKLKPLVFSNGKSQRDLVKEIISHVKNGKKIIFLHGVCGTGKSAIALNIARKVGKSCIVVPIKNLQNQYEKDYSGKMKIFKDNGQKMKIAIITGRDNHDSIIKPGVSCADPTLPDTVKLSEKNYEKIKEFYENNPFIKNKEMPAIKKMNRIAIAPSNPYWSPIIDAEFEINTLKDAKKIKYKGLEEKEFIFYHRKKGCSYYDQYLAYSQADVIIFNSAKYKIEVALGRKPETEVDIIDEGDEFLDSFSTREHLNISRLILNLKNIFPEHPDAEMNLQEILELLKLEEKNKQILGVDKKQIFPIKETKFKKIFGMIIKDLELRSEIEIDEMNYANKFLEVADSLKELLEDIYLTYEKIDENIYVNFVSSGLSKRFNEIIKKNKVLILMSGTIHSKEVLEKVFEIKNYVTVEAETNLQGTIEIHRTGKEIDCKRSNHFLEGYRERYLSALNKSFKISKKPVLIHVNAFEDLPTEEEKSKYEVFYLMSQESLKSIQRDDKKGSDVDSFKEGLQDSLFTTKCSRGIDFPGTTCNSIIFTKYPNPNLGDIFWKVFEKTHKKYFWDYYRDKAKREFLQRLYRGLRSKSDHVYILSPDIRVIKEIENIQKNLK